MDAIEFRYVLHSTVTQQNQSIDMVMQLKSERTSLTWLYSYWVVCLLEREERDGVEDVVKGVMFGIASGDKPGVEGFGAALGCWLTCVTRSLAFVVSLAFIGPDDFAIGTLLRVADVPYDGPGSIFDGELAEVVLLNRRSQSEGIEAPVELGVAI